MDMLNYVSLMKQEWPHIIIGTYGRVMTMLRNLEEEKMFIDLNDVKQLAVYSFQQLRSTG